MLRFLYAVLLIFAACEIGTDGTLQFTKYAYIKSHAGILRLDPVSISPELDVLPYGTKIQIIKKTSEKMKIGSINDYWYFVKTEDLIEGWIYGNSITFLSSEIKDTHTGDVKLDPEKIKEQLHGKWWEIRDDGSTGLGKIYFWDDGKYTYGYGRSDMTEGTYELIKNYIVLDHGSTGGNRLEVFEVGDELRLTGKKKGKVYTFMKGDPDPESPEIGDPEAEDSENEKDGTEKTKKES
ncbi:MAG: SH3 domain-containing protein [Spirochaetia bacterium]|nr:SH3 domain-containing protein [Spirochaetia bacterium]